MVQPQPLQAFMGAANQFGNCPLKDLVEELKKASPGVQKTPLADLDKFIDLLLTKKNGIASLMLFSCKARKGVEAVEDVVKTVEQGLAIIETIETNQMEYVINEFPLAFVLISTAFIDAQQPLNGIGLVKTALDKYSPNKRSLTNLHAAFFALCLYANRFDPALDYLNVDVESLFANSLNGIVYDQQNVLLYFYYGGIIYLALEMYEECASYLEQCVCLPAVSASAIMIEALKKLILVNLMLGRSVQLPAYRSAAIQRASQGKCSNYYSLAVLFNDLCSKTKTKKINRSFSALIAKHESQLVTDKNYGLVKKISQQLFQNRASQLPTVFTKLKLSDVSSYLEFSDDSVNSLQVLITLIEKGQISGKIDIATESVDFEQPSASVSESVNLDEIMKDTVVLADVLQKIQQEVSLHPVYLQRTGKKGHGSGMGVDDEGVVAHGLFQA